MNSSSVSAPEYVLPFVDKKDVIKKNNLNPKIDAFPRSFTELFNKIETDRANPLVAEKFKKLGKEIVYFETVTSPPDFLNSNGVCPLQHPTANLINSLSNDFIVIIHPSQTDLAVSMLNKLYEHEYIIKEFPNDKFVFVNNFDSRCTKSIVQTLKEKAMGYETSNHIYFTAAGNKGGLLNEDMIPHCYPSRYKVAVGALNKKMEPHEKSNFGPNVKLYAQGPEDIASPFVTSTANVCVAGLFTLLWKEYNSQEEALEALYNLATKKEVSFPRLSNHKIYIIDPTQLTVIDGKIRKKLTLFYTVSGQFPYGQWAEKGNTQKTLESGFSPHNFITKMGDLQFNWN